MARERRRDEDVPADAAADAAGDHGPARHGRAGRHEADHDDTPVTFGQRVWTWTKEVLVVVGSALVLSFIIKTFFVQSFWIPSASMEETLVYGDRIVVNKWRPGPADLRRGDIVVFRDPAHWLDPSTVAAGSGPQGVWGDVLRFTGLLPEDAGEHLVKRTVGLPGDTVECRSADGPVYVNGIALDEPYLAAGVSPCAQPGGGEWHAWNVTVPEGSIWVMGDNRPGSADSRVHIADPGGPFIPIEDVVGTAFATVWPLDHWEGLGNALIDQAAAIDAAREGAPDAP